ncbi:MAG: hypothetical protein AAFZ91_10495 [Pseudomonadota bacterium]
MKRLDYLFVQSTRLVFMGFFICMAIFALDIRSDEQRIERIQNGQVDAMSLADTMLGSGEATSPRELIALAEQISQETGAKDARANGLLSRALEIEPRLPSAHAQLTYLQTKQAGRPTESAIEHLEASFWDCPYCNQDLLRWRLAYVIMHWRDIPEEVRLQAFAGADVLRWWYLDYEFLDQIRKEAISKGIAFNAYQRKIYTPVRPSEIGQN